MYELRFVIRGLPPTENRKKKKWQAQWAKAKFWHEQVQMQVLLKGRPDKPLKHARLRLTRYSPVSPDFDGLVSSFKCVIDGLVHAGVLENDSMNYIGVPNYNWQKTKQALGGGYIGVEVIESNEAGIKRCESCGK